MKVTRNRAAVLPGFFAAEMACPALLMAQAPPGPIILPDSAQPRAEAPAPAPPPKKALPQGKPTIFGSWKFNRDESDDARQKLQAAQQAAGGGQTRNGNPRVGVGGGGWPGGGGGGYPGGGGGGGGYGRHPSDSYSDADIGRMGDLLNPSYSLVVVPKENEVELSDEQDRKRAIYTDGRKVQKATSDSFRELDAKWDGDRLVTTEDGPHNGKIERILAPADGGAQLYETFRVVDSKSNATLVVRYVFDRVDPEDQPARR
ncbi:MAG TPA: hypothetical protein VKG84_02060 [Candidatus Acidoferrales bacterium]|nr:hypothetical protein [Candidatus Acidoferrales bacterium]